MRAFEVEQGSTSIAGLVAAERERPEPGPREVLVRIHAASLNYRDLAIVTGRYFAGPVARDTIPLSDGAGRVEAVGAHVRSFGVGDRVVATFTQGDVMAALGSPLDGVLTEYAVFDEQGLLPVPEHLSYEEAATLPHSYQAVGRGGEIALIGVITAPQGDLAPFPLMPKSATLRGIFVGGKPLFVELNKAVTVNGVKPVIDSMFEFEAAVEAYEYLRAAKHVGKVVIRIAD